MNSFAFWIIRGLVPWLVFFAFVNGTRGGLIAACTSALLVLFFLNFRFLRSFSLLDWLSLCFYVLLWLVDWKWQVEFVEQYSQIGAYLIFSCFCFFSLVIGKPFSAVYARNSLSIVNQQSPFFITVNQWISFFWGMVALLSSISFGLFALGIGQLLWMKDIIPTALLVTGIFFTIFFPDRYRTKFLLPGTIIAQKLLSPIKMIAVGGVELAYRTLGKGQLLVLLQDSGLTMHHFDGEFVKALARNYEVLIFDYPGVGYSSYKEMNFTVDTIANYVYEMLAALKKKPLALIGYSMGGWIAQMFAIKYNTMPYAPEALVLIATDCGKASIRCAEEVADESIAWQNEANINGIERAEKRIPFYFPQSVAQSVHDRFLAVHQVAEWEIDVSDAALARLEYFASNWYELENIPSSLQALSIPALIVSGDYDRIIPAVNSDYLSKYFKNAQKVVYQNAGHGIIYHYPLELAETIHKFLSAIYADIT